jgi:nucleoside 2-deoxyribosyltransferase
MTQIYLAARYNRIEELRRYKEILEVVHHHSITSRWLDQQDTEDRLDPNTDIQRAIAEARTDLADVLRATVFALFTDPKPGKGGHNVELGYAIGMGKKIIIIGDSENIFQAQYVHVKDFHELQWAL